MAGLDKKYVRINDFQGIFRDKVSGAPLVGGYIEFFEDEARDTTRNVYMLSGSAPSYEYTDLGNKVYLNSIGTFCSSEGATDDISVFYKAYDDDDGNIIRYYARVYDVDGVFQFDREALPNIFGETDEQDELINYIPNGQFSYHNYMPNNALGAVAPGGWWTTRDVTAATDTISFTRIGSYISNPTGNPRYALRWTCSVVGTGGSYKKLEVRFSNVNTFSSTTQKYTFAFSGKSYGTDVVINPKVVKYYGSGGSATENINLGAMTLSSTYKKQQIFFTFGTNEGKTIGANNDDYVALAFFLPITTTFDIEFTDCILTLGEHDIDIYPDLPTYDSASKALCNSIASDGTDKLRPTSNNYYLHLPMYNTPEGFQPSLCDIGKVFHCTYKTPKVGELFTDGTSYDPATFSSDSIPYQRLADVLWELTTPGHYAFGGGYQYGNFYQMAGATNALIYCCNTAGAATPITDGTNGTAFTIADIHAGLATYDFSVNFSDAIYLKCKTFGGALTAAGVGTSGFTVNTIRVGSTLSTASYVTPITGLDDLTASGSVVLTTITGSYRVQIDGTGTPDTFKWSKNGGVTWEASTVNITGSPQLLENGLYVTFGATTGHTVTDYWDISVYQDTQAVKIIPITAASLSGGEYFLISNTTTNFYVWFKIAGAGSDPAVGGATGIEVDLLGTETIADMNLILTKVLNGFYVCSIQTVAAASMPQSSYFDFYTQAGLYFYIWANKASGGVDPANGGATKAIELTLVGTETAAQVAFAVLSAGNAANYGVPDLRNRFIRAWNNIGSGGLDPDVLIRMDRGDGVYGDSIGTVQDDDYKSHAHGGPAEPRGGADGKEGDWFAKHWQDPPPGSLTSYSGGSETRPTNMQLLFVIKY